MMLACRSSCSSNMAAADASCGTICLIAISDGSIPLPFLDMDCLHPQERRGGKPVRSRAIRERSYPPPDEVNSRNVNLMGRPNPIYSPAKGVFEHSHPTPQARLKISTIRLTRV